MQRIHIKELLRLTLTRKGRAIAKHPLLREGVIEAVKASQIGTDVRGADSPLWETPAKAGQSSANANLERYLTGHWG